jgi:hypothetical protein
MKKQNVIDLANYRDEQQRNTPDTSAPTSPAAISDELKSAIESLIDRLRSHQKCEESR